MLSVTNHTIRKQSVTVKEVDLLQVLRPYLIVRSFPPFVDKDVLTLHFQEATKGIEVQMIEMKEGPEALVFFADPNGMFQLFCIILYCLRPYPWSLVPSHSSGKYICHVVSSQFM